MKKIEFMESWSGLHGDAPIKGIVKAWLSTAFPIANHLVKMKISANFLTFLGLGFAIALYVFAEFKWSAIFLVFSLLADGIDGSVSIISKTSSKFGAVIDATVDKIAEIFWVLALYKIGVKLEFLILIIVFALVQEYLRSRSAGTGLRELGIVTICERPVRASFTFVALIMYHLNFDMFQLPILFWILFQIISFFALLRFVKSNLP